MSEKIARLIVKGAAVQMDRRVNTLVTRSGRSILGSVELEPFYAGDEVVVILESTYNELVEKAWKYDSLTK